MKLNEIADILRRLPAGDEDMSRFIRLLEKFGDTPVSTFTEKASRMRMPKVNAIDAANSLKPYIDSSVRFEETISKMEADKDYTKPVFISIFKTLFPESKPPTESLNRAKLIERIRRERRRQENQATA